MNEPTIDLSKFSREILEAKYADLYKELNIAKELLKRLQIEKETLLMVIEKFIRDY